MAKRIYVTVTIFTALAASVLFPPGSVRTQPFTSREAGELQRQQNRYPRVREARAQKEEILRVMFRNAGASYPAQRLLIRIFKLEREVELWAGASDSYTLIKTYPICSISGRLGPKRRQGDLQVPEGFYRITARDFNPASSYHLSMRINYPNRSDRKLGHPTRPGGDIFVHGDCVSIGCVAMTDDRIKELYIALVDSISAGAEDVPVHIYPCRFDSKVCREVTQFMSASDPVLSKFWSNLQEGYVVFKDSNRIPEETVDREGVYHFSPGTGLEAAGE